MPHGPPLVSGNSAMLSHPSPMLSQPGPLYPHSQPSVYVNPYMNAAHTMGATPVPAYPMPIQSHPSPGVIPSASESRTTLGAGNSIGGLMTGSRAMASVRTVDQEMLDEIHTLHLGYIETEDSPHKLEQREKLESKFDYRLCD